jgi:hypothetical protein
MNEDKANTVESALQPGVQNAWTASLTPTEFKSVHYTALPSAMPGEAFAEEWNTYRQEVGRLLSEGQEGRYILIKGKQIIGICETWTQAREEGLKRYQSELFFVHEIRVNEPHLRVRGLNCCCPS